MLVYAFNQHGEHVHISEATSGKHDYWCVHCKDAGNDIQLIARKGAKRGHSFAHEAESEAQHLKETVYHFEGKSFLIDLFAKSGIEAKDEVRVGDAKADVLVELHDRKFAFEVQYSGQSHEKYGVRNLRYADLGVRCQWLYHPEHPTIALTPTRFGLDNLVLSHDYEKIGFLLVQDGLGRYHFPTPENTGYGKTKYVVYTQSSEWTFDSTFGLFPRIGTDAYKVWITLALEAKLARLLEAEKFRIAFDAEQAKVEAEAEENIVREARKEQERLAAEEAMRLAEIQAKQERQRVAEEFQKQKQREAEMDDYRRFIERIDASYNMYLPVRKDPRKRNPDACCDAMDTKFQLAIRMGDYEYASFEDRIITYALALSWDDEQAMSTIGEAKLARMLRRDSFDHLEFDAFLIRCRMWAIDNRPHRIDGDTEVLLHPVTCTDLQSVDRIEYAWPPKFSCKEVTCGKPSQSSQRC